MDTKMIGDKIAKARREVNMSQAQIAQLLFISPQAVGKWERGESIPDLITFNRLAEILGVDLNYFSENFPSAVGGGAGGSGGTTSDKVRKTDETGGGPIHSDDPGARAERPLLTNFNGSALAESDFAGVTAPKRRFKGSALSGSNFAGADLTGSLFASSDMREANFDGTNLTDCILTTSALTGASFDKTIVVRTEFNKSGLGGAKFTDVSLIDAELTMIDLRRTVFVNCSFNGVDLTYCDLRGLSFAGQTFNDVKFNKTALDEVSFNGATLRNVSFRSPYAITNKYYRAIRTIRFEGAKMDKLTIAALKGLGADLSKVTIL